MKMHLWVLSVVLLSFFQYSPAQGIAGLAPSSRTVDWTHVGIPGGIPSVSWPICDTISPSGGIDDSATIQTAINNCAAGTVILLTSGTFKIHRASVVCFGFSDDYPY